MATTPRPQDDAPRSEDPSRIDTATPDGPGPHDVPDEQVIEQTLPKRDGSDADKPR